MKAVVHNLLGISVIALLFVTTSARAFSQDDLTEKQKALQAELEHSLVAPCCWNMTVDQHDSQAAREVRAKITELIKDGKTKQQILDYFTSQPQYGERILASPSQKTLLGKLAYWLIPLALIVGLAVVAKTIKRFTPAQGAASAKPAAKPGKPDEALSDWEKKVEEELNNFDV